MDGPNRSASHLAKALNDAIASAWAVYVAAGVALLIYLFGDRLGLERPSINLHFLMVVATFLMVFVIEHTQSREIAALHTKLDALIRELDADTTTVGVEELSQEEIDEVRERRRDATGDGPASASVRRD